MTENLVPGYTRLRAGILAYLDGCLQGRAVKALLLEARTETAISEEVHRRNADFVSIIQEDFASMGWIYNVASARLYVARSAESALVELELRREDPDTRSALFQFLEKA